VPFLLLLVTLNNCPLLLSEISHYEVHDSSLHHCHHFSVQLVTSQRLVPWQFSHSFTVALSSTTPIILLGDWRSHYAYHVPFNTIVHQCVSVYAAECWGWDTEPCTC
jgi:hypothetical protein